jgi:hypothetical protein
MPTSPTSVVEEGASQTAKRFRFKSEHHVRLVKEVLFHNPYSCAYRGRKHAWTKIAAALNQAIGISVDYRACKAATDKLIARFRTAERASLRASGIAESHTEVDSLLTELVARLDEYNAEVVSRANSKKQLAVDSVLALQAQAVALENINAPVESESPSNQSMPTPSHQRRTIRDWVRQSIDDISAASAACQAEIRKEQQDQWAEKKEFQVTMIQLQRERLEADLKQAAVTNAHLETNKLMIDNHHAQTKMMMDALLTQIKKG